MRLRIDLAYDGTDFAGWAQQPGLRTVEGELTAALSTMLRATGLKVVTAGRTDSGVHAHGAVTHVDVEADAWQRLPGRSDKTPAQAAVTRLNGILPPDVVVRRVSEAPAGFDARFSALRRHYRYRICDDPAQLDPLRRHDTVAYRRPLDVAAMDAAATSLCGLRDFAAFCKPREGATTIRTLLEYSWTRDDQGILVGTVVADAFCHSMVRALVGGVIPVGEGRMPVDWPAEVQAAGTRDPRVTVMPAHGLTLMAVDYPADDQLEARALEARATRSLEECGEG